ncbi:hypothetical protein D034_4383, partial [Vibrio parahaemolyticus Peru-288]
MNRRPSGY